MSWYISLGDKLNRFSYIPSGSNLTLNFDPALPIGTRLTMLDICGIHSQAPCFFYYKVANTALSAIESNQFYKVGTNETGSYECNSEGNSHVVQYQLCVELPANAGLTDSLTITLKQGNDCINNSEVTVGFTDAITAGGSVAISATPGEECINATAAVSNLAGTGTKVLTVSLLDASGNPINIPDSAIEIANNQPEAKHGNFAAITINSAGSYPISISDLTVGSYKLKVDICSSNKVSYPLAGTISTATSDSLAVEALPEYAVKAELSDSSTGRVIPAEDTPTTLTFDVEYKAENTDSVPIPAVKTKQKNGNGEYIDFT